jgi:hypothetical protein
MMATATAGAATSGAAQVARRFDRRVRAGGTVAAARI